MQGAVCAQMDSKEAMYPLIENNGQWPDQVLYRTDFETGNLFAEKDGFTFNFWDNSELTDLHANPDFNRLIKEKTPEIYGHVYKTKFLNSSFSGFVDERNQQQTHYNYFLGDDESSWAGNCKSYGEIKYQDLYPAIDLKLYSNDFFFKYDFILKPGADATDIQIQYEGQEKLSLKNGRLIIKLSIDEIVEQKPLAWQIVDGVRELVVCNYKLKKNVLSFDFPEGYDQTKELIIDPELIFSTYSGSTADNFGYTATYDNDGYLYSGSSAFGAGYPVTPGAYQQTWGGGDGQGSLVGTDMAITKYDISGTFRVYSTYLGGANDDLPHSLIVNEYDELYVMGTTSSGNFPTSANAYDDTFAGGSPFTPGGVGVDYVNGSDIVLTKFNAEGSDILASTFIGGSGNDGLLNANSDLKFNYADELRGEVEIDNNSNVYIASSTYSTDFPIVNGFQTDNAGGLDGCIVKLDANLSNVIWSSYIGGELDDAGYSLAIDSENNAFVGGGTESGNFPVSSGALQPNYSGGQADGFVAHIDEFGEQIISSTYWGSTAYDQVYFVEADSEDNPHIFGQTMAPNSTFIMNATYGTPNSGMLVSKFNNSLSDVVWSTVFGTGSGEPNLSPTAFLVDVCNNIYLSGWGGTTNTATNPNTDLVTGMETTDDAYQTATNGSDFYILVITNDASDIVYGSFFGGLTSAEHVDGGTSRFDRKGIVYQSVCAGCGSNDDFPIFPADAVSSTNNSTNCNNGVFKFDFEIEFTLADFDAPDVICNGTQIPFNNQSIGANEYLWNFGDDETSDEYSPIHEYAEPGLYEVTLIASAPSTCNLSDTITQQVLILSNASSTLDSLEICGSDFIQIGIPGSSSGEVSYEWTPADFLSDPLVPNPIANPNINMDYMLVISSGECSDTLFQSVNVYDLDLTVSEDVNICSDSETVTLEANSALLNGAYQWSSNSSFDDTLNDNIADNDIEVTVDETSTFYVQFTVGGCSAEEEVTITLLAAQSEIEGDFTTCANDTVTLSILNPSDLLDYHWSPENLIISGQDTPEVEVSVEVPTTFYVETSYLNECSFLDSVLVSTSNLLYTSVMATANPSIIPAGQSSQLNAQPDGYTYSWTPPTGLNNPNIQNPIATPDVTTTYYVTVSDGDCIYNADVRVVVSDFVCGNPSIYVPNAFTPNDDEQNEILYIRGNNLTEVHLQIYDRWGEMVFETFDQNIGWDGTFKGREVDPAVFVYYLEVTCIDSQEYFEKGNITVIR